MSFKGDANPMPQGRRIADSVVLEQAWHGYLADVQRLRASLRATALYASTPANKVTFLDLPPSATNAQIAVAVNEIKAKFNAFLSSLE